MRKASWNVRMRPRFFWPFQSKLVFGNHLQKRSHFNCVGLFLLESTVSTLVLQNGEYCYIQYTEPLPIKMNIYSHSNLILFMYIIMLIGGFSGLTFFQEQDCICQLIGARLYVNEAVSHTHLLLCCSHKHSHGVTDFTHSCLFLSHSLSVSVALKFSSAY